MNLLQSAISIDIQQRIIYTDFMSLSWNGDYKNISLHANGMSRGTSSLIADFKQKMLTIHNKIQQNTAIFKKSLLGPPALSTTYSEEPKLCCVFARPGPSIDWAQTRIRYREQVASEAQ
jgi:hypothetical protein